MECVIESLDGKSYSKLIALTGDRVTGGMYDYIDWNVCTNKWVHLRDLPSY